MKLNVLHCKIIVSKGGNIYKSTILVFRAYSERFHVHVIYACMLITILGVLPHERSDARHLSQGY